MQKDRIVIQIDWGNGVKMSQFGKDDIDQAFAHAKRLMTREDVHGVQVTWEKGNK